MYKHFCQYSAELQYSIMTRPPNEVVMDEYKNPRHEFGI
jgi:hypothetical protein